MTRFFTRLMLAEWSRQDVEDLRVAAYIVSIGRVAQTYRSKGL